MVKHTCCCTAAPRPHPAGVVQQPQADTGIRGCGADTAVCAGRWNADMLPMPSWVAGPANTGSGGAEGGLGRPTAAGAGGAAGAGMAAAGVGRKGVGAGRQGPSAATAAASGPAVNCTGSSMGASASTAAAGIAAIGATAAGAVAAAVAAGGAGVGYDEAMLALSNFAARLFVSSVSMSIAP